MYGQIHNEQHRSSQSSHNAAHSSQYCTNAIRKYHTDSSTVVLFVTVHYLAFVQVVLYMYMSQYYNVNEAPTVCGLAANKFTKHNALHA